MIIILVHAQLSLADVPGISKDLSDLEKPTKSTAAQSLIFAVRQPTQDSRLSSADFATIGSESEQHMTRENMIDRCTEQENKQKGELVDLV